MVTLFKIAHGGQGYWRVRLFLIFVHIDRATMEVAPRGTGG
jgi:hypothetical protein